MHTSSPLVMMCVIIYMQVSNNSKNLTLLTPFLLDSLGGL